MELETLFPVLLFLGTVAILMIGYPVAFSLAGSALFFALLGTLTGVFDPAFLQALPERIYGIMINEMLLAIPLFVFMGLMLERSKISEELLDTLARVFGGIRGGLGISVCLVGGLLAASTGIVGATVVTMGLISLPVMLERRYSPQLASGVICASGTLGQIIPPSIVLIILGDVISSAHQQAQLAQGNFAPTSVSVGDLFLGALAPGVLLMTLYTLYIAITAWLFPKQAPAVTEEDRLSLKDPQTRKRVLHALAPPIFLMVGVLGSIFAGIATPTEAASIGSMGAILLAWKKGQLKKQVLHDVSQKTTEITAMVFLILLGASVFSLVFRGFGGDELVQTFLTGLGGAETGENRVFLSFLAVMALMFVLGFFLDFFEILFVVVPIVGPALLMLGLDPVWLGVMIALNLQTSFLTPPFGFSLFYLKGVARDTIPTQALYQGVIPFIGIQLFLLVVLWYFPGLATALPQWVFWGVTAIRSESD